MPQRTREELLFCIYAWAEELAAICVETARTDLAAIYTEMSDVYDEETGSA